MNTDRPSLKREFLEKHNFGDCKIIELVPDASRRTYSRLINKNGDSYILMDAPPEHESVGSFIKVTNTLRSMHLSAPEIIHFDEKEGFVMLEDLGDDSINKFISNNPHFEEEYYLKCVDVLSTVYQNFSEHNHYDNYDINYFLKEGKIFADYCIYSPSRSTTENEELNHEYKELLTSLYDLILEPTKKTLVLRDYHADNLHILPMRKGVNSIGLLDYQDALVGHPCYDLMSLLEDARRDVGAATVHKCVDKFISDNSFDHQDFMFAYYIWALQRNLKIVGIFNRKVYRDGNLNYQKFLPRVWRYIIGDINQPHLMYFKNFIEKVIQPVG
ncbi:MAG: phosphotransferase [Alphaproteobacteria bacterium]|nr:phosphotransferase [Alphaproteobacteria bacterium]OJV15709.1 MAG: hypothetical protein BGO27_07315 [Alphaproteobacteria bacterium 33-17]